MLDVSVIDRMGDLHLVKHFLLASFCYYHLDESPMTDDAFDKLCRRLLDRYDHIDHPHLQLISKDDLRAGSGYAIRYDEYPMMVQSAAAKYTALCLSGEMGKMLEPELKTAAARPARILRRPTTAPTVVPEPVKPGRIMRSPRKG